MNVIDETFPIYEFPSFTEDMVRKAFGLQQTLKVEGFLSNWVECAKSISIDSAEEKQLERLNKKVNLYVRGWNEQELREKLIAPVIDLVDYDLYDLQIAAFAEREMKVTYNKSIIKGKVEWMVAQGISDPTQPFFFIHPDSYRDKKEIDASNDPVGQLLATLCTAQLLNGQELKPTLFKPTPHSFSDIPLYGTYIVGRFWFFVRLKEKEYYISKAYNSEELEDLVFILKMLKAQKEMIVELAKTMQ